MEILKRLRVDRTEEELLEIKKLLSEFLLKKAIAMADNEHVEKGYSDEDMDAWATGHFRAAMGN